MYGLAHDVDLSFFLQKALLQVCVGKNEVILNFDSDVRLTILSKFAIENAGQARVTVDESTVGAAALLPLLHDTVIASSRTAEGGLQLAFESGARIVVFDTSEQYESFWIHAQGKEIIV